VSDLHVVKKTFRDVVTQPVGMCLTSHVSGIIIRCVESMSPVTLQNLSRRERQIMDILYERQSCAAQEIQANLPDPPSYSAVRALLARLVEKGLISFRQDGAKYIYFPCVSEVKAQKSALSRLLKTFFKGSSADAVNALLDMDSESLSVREIDELERKIRNLKSNRKSG
jgi:BlaI family transcriptional regulator, penicillinase repressor